MRPPWQADLASSERVLFVCSGNMIRSAYAELWARHRGCPRPVLSVGTTYFNDALHPRTAAALLERGVDEAWVRSFRPTHLSRLGASELAGACAFGMTEEHLRDLAVHPERPASAHLLSALDGGPRELADPLFHGDWRAAFARIEHCVDELLGALE